jgi:hypothetical protein
MFNKLKFTLMKRLFNYSYLVLLCFVAFACSKEDGAVDPTASLSGTNTKNTTYTNIDGYKIGCLDYWEGEWSFEIKGPGNVQGAGMSNIQIELLDCKPNTVALGAGSISNAYIWVGTTKYTLTPIYNSDGSCDKAPNTFSSFVKFEIPGALGDILKMGPMYTLYFTLNNGMKLSGANMIIKTGNQNDEKCFYGYVPTCYNYCYEKPKGCTYTQGYWKTHGPAGCARGNNMNEWPVTTLMLGSRTYTDAELCAILNTPVQGNGLINLAHQLIAAKLNVANGASGSSINSSITAADALIGSLVIPPVGSGYLAPRATSALVTALSNYNEGITGPGHCD